MIARSQEILKKAQKGGYAVGAFNTNNLEITQAIIEAAEELNSPVIIQTTPSAIEYAGLEEIYGIIRTAISSAKIPAVLHLDHGKHFEICRQAVDIGYPSVMIDASILPFEENVRLVQRVVKYAHQKGVAVESEIGALGKGEEGVQESDQNYTDPVQAAEFVKLTGVDSLGVSIGNVHGAPEDEKINVGLLKEIKSKITIPLVLHGSSGLSADDIHSAIKHGICKINIDTNIRKAAIEAMKDGLRDNPKDYRDVLGQVRDDVKAVVKKYIKLLGSDEKGRQ